MHAYGANMEAARREAPADIEWPKLDGRHGIPVLNMSLGSLGYVQVYMRGKSEMDAKLSNLLSVESNRCDVDARVTDDVA
eukprot:jgi/Tetstr1/429806/TSEL_019673.t1